MKRFAILIAALALVAAACGGDDSTSTSAATGTRTIKIQMQDIKYSTTAIDIKRGETVRFQFKNAGKVAHDAFIGDEAAQAAHEAQMNGGKSNQTTTTMGSGMNGQTTMDSGMTGGSGMAQGGNAGGITVKPGDTGELTYTFDKAGTILIGCHQPGHYATGMKVTITVT